MSKPKIARLQLENFRAHRELDVQFGPGLNVIFGPNNAGKSTILKAIQSLTGLYRSSRERTLTTGTSRGSVRLTMSTGDVVEREYTKRHVRISIPPDIDMKNPTPDVLQGTIERRLSDLGLAPLRDGRSEPWWPQFYSVGQSFLVSDTPSVVKRILSLLSYTDVYERARDIAKLERDRLAASIRADEAEVVKKKDALSDVEGRLSVLAPINISVKSLVRDLEALKKLIRDIDDAQKCLSKSLELLLDEKTCSRLREISVELGDLLKKLLSIEESLRLWRSSIIDVETALKSVDPSILDIDVEKVSSLVEASRSEASKLDSVDRLISEISDQVRIIEEAERSRMDAKESLASQERALEDARAEAVRDGICPILGGLCPRSVQGERLGAGS